MEFPPHSTPPPGPAWKIFFHRWVIQTIAVMVAGSVVSGIRYDRPGDLLAASLLLGMAHAFVRPVLMLISLPLVILSLGLFVLVINAGFLLAISALLRPRFLVDSFSSAFWGGLVISLVSMILGSLTGLKSNRTQLKRTAPQHPPKPPPSGDSGSGPVIDV